MDAALSFVNAASHNARAAQIRKFVSTPPKRATTLRLVTAEDPPQTLGEWDVTQAEGNGALSLEVSALLEEHTQTAQRHTQAVLGWMIGDTKIVASKLLRARYTPPPDEAEDGDQLSFEALGINGTTAGQVIQMQRHLEVRERTSNTFVHGLMQTALQLNGQLQAQLQDSYARNHELQQQIADQWAAAAQDYQDVAAGADDTPPPPVDSATEARTQAIQVITGIAQQYGPTLIQAALVKLTAPKAAIQLAPPPAPAPPVAPSAASSPPTPPVAPAAPAAAAAQPAAAPAAPAPPARPTRAPRGTSARARPPARPVRGRK